MMFGRDGGPRPEIDRDRGDVHQTFAEVGSDLHGRQGYSLRVGRQELVFGAGRLIDDNEGGNVKFAFDGLRVTARKGASRVDLFAVKPVEINPGFFDDSPDHKRSLWGVYGTAPVPHVSKAKADLYYIDYDSKQAMYQLGAGREIRHSAGTRVFNREAGQPPTAGVDYNWEGIVQWGALGPNSIHAWTVATETGYTLGGKNWHPRFVLRAEPQLFHQAILQRAVGSLDAALGLAGVRADDLDV